MGALKLSFKAKGALPVTAVGIPAVISGTTGTQAPVKELELSDADQEVLKELEDNRTMLEDPAQWEQDIINEHILNGAKNERNDNRRAE